MNKKEIKFLLDKFRDEISKINIDEALNEWTFEKYCSVIDNISKLCKKELEEYRWKIKK